MTTRRFPPPWRIVEHAESYWVQDATGQAVGWFYFRDNPEVARHEGVPTRDEARRMAVNFARLRSGLGRLIPVEPGQPPNRNKCIAI